MRPWVFVLLSSFGVLSTICFATECYEIYNKEAVVWSDYLHNLIDHLMYIIVNFISFKVAKK